MFIYDRDLVATQPNNIFSGNLLNVFLNSKTNTHKSFSTPPKKKLCFPLIESRVINIGLIKKKPLLQGEFYHIHRVLNNHKFIRENK